MLCNTIIASTKETWFIKTVFFTGCYGVKPDSVGASWTCSRCAKGAWTVVSSSTKTIPTYSRRSKSSDFKVVFFFFPGMLSL